MARSNFDRPKKKRDNLCVEAWNFKYENICSIVAKSPDEM